MRTLAITQNITLDGAIEMLGDWFDPMDQDPELLEETRTQSAGSDAIVLGRRTFEDFRGFWPQQTDDETGITDELNRIEKYVVSSTLTDPQWQNSTVLTGDWVARVQALKAQSGLDIVVTGSIMLTHGLIEFGLVDEYRLFVHPAVQGRGRRLFPDGYETSNLQLVEARGFPSGVSLLRYTVRETGLEQ
ncbi:dihydrofolate reductase family protein [Rhodococcus sp. NPDC060090]|uniref:dihydrofolate reductase family protein n=1 Tax=Rhodococcus sp. NPDC060090 TaxID=3347056 RepID=UPI00365A7C26